RTDRCRAIGAGPRRAGGPPQRGARLHPGRARRLQRLPPRRPRSRVGIPVPDDPGQIIYVWWDALANYITALGYGGGDELPYRDWWVNSCERVHVIGKGITRFHAVYWLALLLSAGQPQPTSFHLHECL